MSMVTASPAAGRAREARATDNAPRRPRQKQVDRPARGGTDGGNAAAGLHDVDLAGDTVLAKALLHVGERPLHRRAHVGVEGSHRGPFVLAVDGVHLRGERDEQIGIQRVDDLSRTHLVRVVLEREQVDHRHRLDRVLGLHLDDRPGDEVLVERLDQPAGRVQPFGNAHSATLGRQEYRCLHVDIEVVHGPALETADLEHVLESLGGEDGEPRPRPLHHDVGGKGSAEHDSLHAFRLAIQEAENLADPADHALDDVGGIGDDFGEADLAPGLVDAHHVGEGTTDVDPYDHGSFLHGRRCPTRMTSEPIRTEIRKCRRVSNSQYPGTGPEGQPSPREASGTFIHLRRMTKALFTLEGGKAPLPLGRGESAGKPPPPDSVKWS